MAIYRYYSKRAKRHFYKVYVETDSVGKRHRRYVDTFPTRKEAERAEREALDARDRGIDLAPTKVTVGELLERWMRDRKARNLGAKTLQEDGSKIGHHIRPYIGALPLSKLRPAHLSDLYARLLESGRILRKKDPKAPLVGLAPKTVRHVHTLLHAALSWALKMQLVGRNVADAVEAPRAAPSPARALAPEEIGRLLEQADRTPLGPFVRVALFTGARRGELLALTWADVDFEAARMMIRASLSEVKGALSRKSPKTDRVRTVALAPAALEALRKQRALQEADQLASRGLYRDGGYVFADSLGRPLMPSYVSDQFRKITKRAGVRARLHDSRHTAATAMILSGADVRTVGAVLGHAAPSTTLNIYGHVIVGAQPAAVASIERYATGRKA